MSKKPTQLPEDPIGAFAYLVGKCAEGCGGELMTRGRTADQARNIIIGCFLDFAAGEACRMARRDGRKPDPSKWLMVTTDAYERAVKRTRHIKKGSLPGAADSGFSKARPVTKKVRKNGNGPKPVTAKT